MTNTGAFLWAMIFVLLIIGLLRKGREDADEQEDIEDHLSDDQELKKNLPKTENK
jgi:hypothetical protein